MSEIEKIKRYIEQTPISKPQQYELGLLTAITIKDLFEEQNMMEAVYMAFLYGRAKGYRAAKAEARK